MLIKDFISLELPTLPGFSFQWHKKWTDLSNKTKKNMKKIFLSAVAISLMSLGVMAQTTISPNRGGFIIRGGVNLANISVTDNGRVDKANSLTSFHAGIGYDIPLSNFFSLQPGLIYTGKGAKTQLGKETDNFYYKATSNPMYLELPVNFVGKIPVGEYSKIYFGAGPYAAAGIAGKNKVETHIVGVQATSTKNIVYSNDNPTTSQEENYGYGKLKRFDYGINALAGIEFPKFSLGVNYGYGLVKINSGSDNTANDKGKNRVASLSLGIKL
jgi:hypothetical protein